MTTSNSYDFELDRDDIIGLAHQHISAIGEGETPTAAQISEAALLLNMIVKLREADGMPLWALKRGFILPFTGASSINTDSHVVTSYKYTTLANDAASGAGTITLTDVSNIVGSDVIGIETTEGMEWTSVVSVVSSTVNLTDTLVGDASSGGEVYVYTPSNRIQKPLRIIEANILLSATSNSHGIEIEERADYFNLGNRTSEGVPNLIYFDRASTSDSNLNNGTFYVFPRFMNGDYVIEFTYHRPFQDFDSASDTPDFPQAFYLPLMLELAALLGPKFGLPIDERNDLKGTASHYLDQALMTIQPEGSLKFQRNTGRA